MITEIKKFFAENKSFFYLYLAFLILVGGALLFFTKAESFLFINHYYAPWADVFFKGFTGLGDGLFFLLVTLVLALFRYRYSLLGLAIFLSSSLLAQLLKHTFFSNFKRPLGMFGDAVGLHLVEGVATHVNNSFPSGHTTTVFALALFLTLAFNLKRNGWLLALVAILVGYSRVYLVQHFPVDVYFGSLLGILSCLLIYAWLNEPLKTKFGDKGLLSKK